MILLVFKRRFWCWFWRMGARISDTVGVEFLHLERMDGKFTAFEAGAKKVILQR